MSVREFCLEKPPVVHVLMQMVHEPKLDEEVMKKLTAPADELANLLAEKGFPIHGMGVADSITNQPGQVLFSKTQVALFLNELRTIQFVVTPNSVVVQASRYEQYDSFVDQMRDALECIISRLEPRRLIRLGLRYVNHIQLNDGERFENYLDPGLLGWSLAGNESGVERYWRSENFYPNGKGGCSVRCSRMRNEPYFPVGIEPLGLDYGEAPSTTVGEHVVTLDIDCFELPGCEFQVDNIVSLLRPLNDAATSLFVASITTHARRVWQEKGSLS